MKDATHRAGTLSLYCRGTDKRSERFDFYFQKEKEEP